MASVAIVFGREHEVIWFFRLSQTFPKIERFDHLADVVFDIHLRLCITVAYSAFLRMEQSNVHSSPTSSLWTSSFRPRTKFWGLYRDETRSFRYTVGTKSLDLNNVQEFNRQKQHITNDCNIFVLGRLLEGWILPDILQTVAEQQLETELGKVATRSTECSICLDTETYCDVPRGFHKMATGEAIQDVVHIVLQAIMPRDIFKTPEYIATLRALEDEQQLLQNIDCQRCVACGALMHNETMFSRQKCLKCRRDFCFFCNRNWNVTTMFDQEYTCGKECVYQTKTTFQLVPFHYRKNMRIPNQRTCPRCFTFGLYDGNASTTLAQYASSLFVFCASRSKRCARRFTGRHTTMPASGLPYLSNTVCGTLPVFAPK
ncbi:unnamed protein product [Mortierella alpina]